MMRGTFANVRIKNKIVEREGGYSKHFPTGDVMTVYETAMSYQANWQTPLIVLASKDYGSGTSRDSAAKGASLLGMKAVIAERYERIHRSKWGGMGVATLVFTNGER